MNKSVIGSIFSVALVLLLLGHIANGVVESESGILWEVTLVSNNSPPDPPVITGPTSGKIREVYNYDILVIDPDGDHLASWEVDFGDEVILQENCGCENPVRGPVCAVRYRYNSFGRRLHSPRYLHTFYPG